MHAFVNYVFNAYLQLVVWTSDLAAALAGLGQRGSGHGELAMATIVVTSLIVCALGCAWALAERVRAAAAHYRMNGTLARAQSETRFREAMLLASPEAIVVMGADMPAPLSYRGGSALLQACLSGPDSVVLAARLAALLEGGVAFSIPIRTTANSSVAVQGGVVGSRAALFMRIEEGSSGLDRDLKAILEALPVPVWIRDRALALTWANPAFLTATGTASLGDALAKDPRLIRSERDLASAALDGHDVLGERRYTVVAGQRRALSVDLMRLPSSRVAGVAIDVTQSAQAEGQLTLSADAYGDVMDHMEGAVAIFGADRRLAFHNKLFARTWGLGDAWLGTQPRLDDILDRLREMRRLPEQRDFAGWKREHLRLFESDNGGIEEIWHAHDGGSMRVKAHPYLLGGVFYVFEDITERLRLSGALHKFEQVQRATLDAFDDGVAVFAMDGKLKVHNNVFAHLWQLSEDELSAEPHLAHVAALCTARLGRDGIWKMISSAISSSEPARYGEWGRLTRADGKVLSLSLTRLPQGATLVVFEDCTDLENFEAGLGEGNAASA